MIIIHAALGLSDGLCHGLQQLLELGRQVAWNWRQLTGGDVAEKGGEAGERDRELFELGKGFFLGGAEVAIAEAGLSAGEGERLQGLEHLGRHAAATSGAAFALFAQCIALLRPLRGGGALAPGLGDVEEDAVIPHGFHEAEGFADLAGCMGVALSGGEVAEAEVDLGE